MKSGDQMKWGVQITPTTTSFVGWFIILPTDALSSRTKLALVDVGVLILKSGQKKVTTNMVTLNFRTFPKITVHDGLALVPEAKLDIINPMTEK